MIVVSNTSPLANLAAVGRLHLLADLYGTILIPVGVQLELQRGEQRGDHLPFLSSTQWLITRPVSESFLQTLAPYSLDLGETQAIGLALELKADILLIDERKGRQAAKSLGLRVAGTLGTLIAAKRRGLIFAVQPVVDELIQKCGFRVKDTLYEYVLRQAGERD
ncbi:MAG: DUF3368 domain-containing protein [Fimbriimonadales bacterium]|nr:DUF3368 domain-containing protein [Fimbriimonadales bacterium]